MSVLPLSETDRLMNSNGSHFQRHYPNPNQRLDTALLHSIAYDEPRTMLEPRGRAIKILSLALDRSPNQTLYTFSTLQT